MVTSFTFPAGISSATATGATSPDLGWFDSVVEAARTNPDMATASPNSVAQKLFEGVVTKAQEIIDAGNEIGNASPAASGALTKLSSSAAIGGEGAGIDVSGVVRAYDFAMRSYLLSKMVAETAGGLKSLWQAT